MNSDKFANLLGPESLLTAPLLAGAVSCTVNDPSNFTVLQAEEQFSASIQDDETSPIEIVLVTVTAGAIFTIVRAQEGTTAIAHKQGATIAQVITKRIIDTIWPKGRFISSDVDVNIDGADGSLALGVQNNPGPINVNLPANAIRWKDYPLADLGQDFGANPVTVIPNAGGNILGNINWPMDITNQALIFYTPDNVIWGIR